MTLDEAEVHAWSAERLLEEFEKRWGYQLVNEHLHNSWLEENERIGRVCLARFACHPNFLRDNGHVLGSWTDTHGVHHDWRGRYRCPGVPHLDRPTRAISCITCLEHFP